MDSFVQFIRVVVALQSEPTILQQDLQNYFLNKYEQDIGNEEVFYPCKTAWLCPKLKTH